MEKLVHRSKQSPIVRRGGKQHTLHTEGLSDSYRHIGATEVHELHLGALGLLFYHSSQGTGHSGCMAMDRGISNEHALALGLVAAPFVVETDVITQVLSEHGTMERTDALYIECPHFPQQCLHGLPILTTDVVVVAASLIGPCLITLCILDLTLQNTEGTEGIG